jgi:UDP-2,3-diacylglucosamine pyrophosphatase LpxH
MSADDLFQNQGYRTIFISDFHLGTKGAQADKLLDFLKYNESEYLYLVGDIFDGWQLKKRFFWPEEHNTVIQKLLRKSRKGTHVYYIPGNHDEFARDYTGFDFGGIIVQREMTHETVRKKRFLILHGDEFDGVVKFHPWLAVLGSHAYELSIRINRYYNAIRRWMGKPYWSLSNYLKQRVKNAVKYIGEYENAVVEEARKRQCDGIICGHIHKSEIREMEGIMYCNTGDWVESCTALVEHHDGSMELINWLESPGYMEAAQTRSRKPAENPTPAPAGLPEPAAGLPAMLRRQ